MSDQPARSFSHSFCFLTDTTSFVHLDVLAATLGGYMRTQLGLNMSHPFLPCDLIRILVVESLCSIKQNFYPAAVLDLRLRLVTTDHVFIGGVGSQNIKQLDASAPPAVVVPRVLCSAHLKMGYIIM